MWHSRNARIPLPCCDEYSRMLYASLKVHFRHNRCETVRAICHTWEFFRHLLNVLWARNAEFGFFHHETILTRCHTWRFSSAFSHPHNSQMLTFIPTKLLRYQWRNVVYTDILRGILSSGLRWHFGYEVKYFIHFVCKYLGLTPFNPPMSPTLLQQPTCTARSYLF